MTFTISKKELVYWAAIVILVIASSASFLAYKAGAQETGESTSQEQSAPEEVGVDQAEKINQDQPNIDFADRVSTASLTSESIPHASCRLTSIYLLPVSTTYVEPTNFNTDFLYTGGTNFTTLQDINGDNLPDFVFTSNTDNVGSADIGSTHWGCVYLNNGTNWEKVWQCFARTTVDKQTGNVLEREYRGDCAG